MAFTFTSLCSPLDDIIDALQTPQKDSVIEHLQKAAWELNQLTPNESEAKNVADNIAELNRIVDWLENRKIFKES